MYSVALTVDHHFRVGLLVRTHTIARTGKIDLPHIRRKLDKEELDSGARCAPKVSHTDCGSIESYL